MALEYDIVREFRKELSSKTTDIGAMYHHMFSMIADDELKEKLEAWMDEYVGDKKGWFSRFHKFLRQGDFFDIHSYRIVNKLTPEQEVRRKEIQALRDKEWERFKILQPDENWDKYKEFRAEFEDKEILAELQELNKLRRFQEETRISGHLDMLLWNTIHLDKKNELKKSMEFIFKLVLDIL